MCCLKFQSFSDKFQSFSDNYCKIGKVLVDVCEENMNSKCLSLDSEETKTFKAY